MLNIPIKDHLRETRIFSSRVTFSVALIVIATIALVARLVYLQIVDYKHYETMSEANSINAVPIPPVRGYILDRNGIVLAQNYPVYTLQIVPDQVKHMPALLDQLGKLVRLNDRDIKTFYRAVRGSPRFESVLLRTNLTDGEAARVAVNLPDLPGVQLRAQLQRYYPLGSLAVQAVGYVGRINEEEAAHIDKSVYRGVDYIGKLGIEAQYERALLGKVGLDQIETNAHGQAVRTLGRIPPVAGKNIYLTLDAKLQAIAAEAMAKNRGAVVAMDPRTGAILAFVSTPTYDPNPFVNGIDPSTYQALLDNPGKPLIDRVINGQYAPGSTIKPFYALGALEQPGFDPDKKVDCKGWFRLPNSSHVFHDWKRFGHGPVDLDDAIEQSCDVYFYTLAANMGIDYMDKVLGWFGFGHKTGVDLPGESDGLVPSPAWAAAHGQGWYTGETVVTGIGQGALLVTPLQLVTAVSSIADDGILMTPHLLYGEENPSTGKFDPYVPQVHGQVPGLTAHDLQVVIKGMLEVVNGPHGTARGIGWNAPYTIAGKTGTAQVMNTPRGDRFDEDKLPPAFRDHALFISFAPVQDPKIAVAVIVENGGHGGGAAAPVARKIMDYYLLKEQPEEQKPASVPPPVNPQAPPGTLEATGPGPQGVPAPPVAVSPKPRRLAPAAAPTPTAGTANAGPGKTSPLPAPAATPPAARAPEKTRSKPVAAEPQGGTATPAPASAAAPDSD